MQRIRRIPAPITVAYLDVDDFKVVNDRHGHAEGDEVIRVIGTALAAGVCETDVVARLGGDEFAVLLPHASPAVARTVLGRIHGALVDDARRQGWHIGFSIGAVTWSRPPLSADEMLSKADEVMYDVKTRGTNTVRCIEICDPATSTSAQPPSEPRGRNRSSPHP